MSMHHTNSDTAMTRLSLPALAPLTVEVPSPDAFLVGLAADARLLAPWRTFVDTADAWDVALAVGTLVRLWEPRTPADVRAAVSRLMTNEDPMTLARAWVQSVPGLSSELTGLAHAEIVLLYGHLTDLSDTAGLAEREATRLLATSIRERRDDLESLAALFGPAWSVASSLAIFDASAGAMATTWLYAGHDSIRLARSDCASPGGWWIG